MGDGSGEFRSRDQRAVGFPKQLDPERAICDIHDGQRPGAGDHQVSALVRISQRAVSTVKDIARLGVAKAANQHFPIELDYAVTIGILDGANEIAKPGTSFQNVVADFAIEAVAFTPAFKEIVSHSPN